MQNGAVTSDRTQVFQVKVGDSTTVTTPSKTKLRYCSEDPHQGSGWFFVWLCENICAFTVCALTLLTLSQLMSGRN